MNTKSELRLEGAPNFRDLGGGEARDGRRVRQGILYRSSNLAQLTPGDLDNLRRHSVRTLLDMRGQTEAQMYPSRWPDDLATERINVSINPVLRVGQDDYQQILLDDPTPAGAMKAIAATYRMLPDACGPALKLTVDRVLAGKTPMVFHCSNGRDRTGVIAMLVLSILGVSRADIRASHVESNTRLDLESAIQLSAAVFSKEMGFNFDYPTLRTLNQALAQSVDVAFDTITATHGSAEDYLNAFDITPARQDALRTTLLEAI